MLLYSTAPHSLLLLLLLLLFLDCAPLFLCVQPFSPSIARYVGGPFATHPAKEGATEKKFQSHKVHLPFSSADSSLSRLFPSWLHPYLMCFHRRQVVIYADTSDDDEDEAAEKGSRACAMPKKTETKPPVPLPEETIPVKNKPPLPLPRTKPPVPLPKETKPVPAPRSK